VTESGARDVSQEEEGFAARLSGANLGDRAYRIVITAFAACVPILLVLIAWEIGIAG